MTRLAILLHGVGAHGSSIAWMADHLAQPDLAFVAPDAPHAFDQAPVGPARQWFSVTGVTPENRAARVAAARDGFDAALRQAMQAHGVTDPARVALIGFSQGSIMALDAVATGRWQVGLVVAFSGRLATSAPLMPAHCQILLAHGRQDTVIPFAESAQAQDRLAAAGGRAELLLEDRLGHAPGAQGMARARALLQDWTTSALV